MFFGKNATFINSGSYLNTIPCKIVLDDFISTKLLFDIVFILYTCIKKCCKSEYDRQHTILLNEV